jgi:hypothetical protein
MRISTKTIVSVATVQTDGYFPGQPIYLSVSFYLYLSFYIYLYLTIDDATADTMSSLRRLASQHLEECYGEIQRILVVQTNSRENWQWAINTQ